MRGRVAIKDGLAVIAAAAGLGMSTLVAGAGPTEVTEPQAEFREHLDVGQVLLPVVVRTTDGHAQDLRVDDFRLFVDGSQVPIRSLDSDFPAPVSVIFLQDLSGSMAIGGRLATSRQFIDCLLDSGRPQDRYSLVTFGSGRVQVELAFSRDRELVRKAMTDWRAFGISGIHDALSWMPEVGLETTSKKRAAVLLTDGLDNASNLNVKKVRLNLARARMPVFVVALHSRSSDTRSRDNLPLIAMAEESGGRYFDNPVGSDLAEPCSIISDDLRHQYMLGFSVDASGPRSFRRVEVALARGARGTRRQRPTLFHKTGYFGSQPQSPQGGGVQR